MGVLRIADFLLASLFLYQRGDTLKDRSKRYILRSEQLIITILQTKDQLYHNNLWQSSSPPSTRASSLLSSRRLCLSRLRGISHRLFDVALSSRRELVLCSLLAGRRIPVKNHLQREDSVESEPSDEAVEDDFVGDFLQGCEDAREGAEEVGEDLCLEESLAFVDQSGWVGKTYGESRELTSASLAEDSNDLRQLRQSSDSARTHLQVLQQLRAHNIAVEQQEPSSSQRSNKHCSHVSLARVLQHQKANRNILNHNESCLAK